MIPIPPSWAMAMARFDSVTVSMAADTSGMFRVMLRVSRVASEVSRGSTWENAGTNRTSSKVSAVWMRRMGNSGRKARLYAFRPDFLGVSPRVSGYAVVRGQGRRLPVANRPFQWG